MSIAALQPQLDKLGRLQNVGPDQFAARRAALDTFATYGLPGRKLEAWRYTDFQRVDALNLDFVPALPSSDKVASVRELCARLPYSSDTALAVFIDGHFVPELARVDGHAGLAVGDGPARPTVGTDAPGTTEDPNALALLNTAFAEETRIRIDGSGVRLTVLVVTTSGGVAAQLRLPVTLSANSNAKVNLHFCSIDGVDAGWTSVVAEIDQAAGSALDLLRIQELSGPQSLTTLLRHRLGRNAALALGSFDCGGALIRTDVEAVLFEPGAAVNLFGIASVAAEQHVDNHLCVDHAARETRSSQTFRNIVDANGRGVFNGKVIVREDSQRIDAQQRSDNLLLSPRAEVDTKPELEIYADDVRCSHGATVGEIDEEQLFYLRSRGIDADAARTLITFAFANTVLERIEDQEVRRYLVSRISGREDEARVDLPDDFLLQEDPS